MSESVLRPWRKRALQIITTDIWAKDAEGHVEPIQQVAGHGSWDDSARMLIDKEGCILKPVQAPPRGEREIAFYETITNSTDTGVHAFEKFTPKYFGVKTRRNSQDEESEFLVIENLTKGMKKACVMDIKIGAKTYNPEASEKKKAQEDAKYVGTKKPLGFSVLGMNVFTGESFQDAKVLDKEFGKTLSKENVKDVVKHFLNTDENDPEVVSIIAGCFLKQLKEILALFKKQTVFHLFGSSLLFLYDADAIEKFKETKDSEKLGEAVKLKMIDFAHVFLEEEIDENYIFGIENLVKLFDLSNSKE